MLKVAIVGCGKIADVHASQIQSLGGCEIVGASDRSPDKAADFSRRFGIRRSFVDLPELVDKARPDVVHITTSAESHFELARFCLEHGCNVYVEKPFTLRASEARLLIDLGEARRLTLTVGHNNQFSNVSRRMRALIQNGYLGGRPLHIESYYSYDLSDPTYARGVLEDKEHWVRRLPGRLLQNVISHGIARIAEFFTSAHPSVIAHGFVSPHLKKLGEHEIIDELRVLVTENERTTAYFTFSSQMKPAMHELRLYGPKNGLLLEQDNEVLLKLRGKRFRSYAGLILPPALLANGHITNLATNLRLFLSGNLHKHSGMRHLIQLFYSSIRNGTPVPIPYPEILRTATIMDAIFEQLIAKQSNHGARFRETGESLK